MKNNGNNFSSVNFNVKALKDGAEQGYCRICGKYAQLTEDHVPPKSCGNKGRTQFYIAGAHSIFMQNGFHCKTICANCNNKLLGDDLDKEYKKVYDQVKAFTETGLYLPRNLLEIDVDVKKFFRCIIAHFFSVAVYEKDSSIKEVLENPLHEDFISENCRTFVLGEDDKPKNVDLYYWYYPFSNIYVNPFMGYSLDLFASNKSVIYGAMIKCSPIAVFILDKKASTSNPPGLKVDLDKNKLFFNMSTILDKEIMEHPTKNGCVLLSPNNIVDGEKK